MNKSFPNLNNHISIIYDLCEKENIDIYYDDNLKRFGYINFDFTQTTTIFNPQIHYWCCWSARITLDDDRIQLYMTDNFSDQLGFTVPEDLNDYVIQHFLVFARKIKRYFPDIEIFSKEHKLADKQSDPHLKLLKRLQFIKDNGI